MDEAVLEKDCQELKLPPEVLAKAKKLFEGWRMDDVASEAVIFDLVPELKEFDSAWMKSAAHSMTLTSVGIAIGHAHMRTKTGFNGDLSIWVN